jgi:hypothetical protein
VTVAEAVGRIRRWGEAHDWRGWDPYDALNSPAAPVLTLGTALGRRLLTQAVKHSPLNVRPLLGIRPEWNAKALGLVASGYTRLAGSGDAAAAAAARRWLDWLAENHSGDETGRAWGYHFDVQTRFFRYARCTPNAIATAFVGQAFLEAGDAEVARSAAEFVVSRLRAGGYFRYVPGEDELVHNANLLACSLVAGAGLAEPAKEALVTSLDAQRPDGSWPYSEGPRGQWVDNFHTAYVLESLASLRELDPRVPEALERGLAYWTRELFLPDGRPKYTPAELYPIDAHCYASAIDTCVATGRLDQARRLASLLAETMLDRSGHVWFQRGRFWTNRTPFVRWTTAPAFRALAGLLLADRDADLDRSR